jgi:hypothetical protein
MKATDEMLMAYADGELDETTAEALQRTVDADPALLRRLADFQTTRALAKSAFAAVLDEEVPERLFAAVRPQAARLAVLRLPRLRWGWLPVGAAVAASVAGLALGTALTLRPAGEASLLGSEQRVAELLETVPSGEMRPLPTGLSGAEPSGTFRATGSYLAAVGVCRSFEVALGADSVAGWRGVACRRDGDWTIELVVADPAVPGGENYAPASDAAAQAVDAFLDAAGSGGTLDEAAERRLVESGWQTRTREANPD